MFLSCQHDPFEPLDRRWRRAGYLVEHRLAPSPLDDDDWVIQAVAFRSALATCGDEADRLRLAGERPELYQAHRLFHGDSGPRLLRCAAEARLLAREPLD